MTIENYATIQDPYTNYLDKDISEGQINNGNVETMPVKSAGALDDVWINNFIKSTNWQPKKVGFSINGLTGAAEFMNVYVSGNIQALTGTIGGFTIGASTISATNLVLTSGAANTANISVGTGSNVAGINSVVNGTDIAFWAGAPFVSRDSGAFTVTAAGAVVASNFTATGGTITGLTIQTASSGLRMVMDGPAQSYKFMNSSTLLSELKTMTIPDSGLSGAALAHGTGEVLLGVSGQGVGLGGRSIVMQNGDASAYFGFFDLDNGNYTIEGNVPIIFGADSWPVSTNTYDIGSASLAFDNTYARSVRATDAVYTDNLNGYTSGAPVTLNDPIVLQSQLSDPTGANGMMYYDATNNRIRAYVNSAWKTVTVA